MAHPSFGNPWPQCDAPTAVLVRDDGARGQLRVPVHRELTDLIGLLIDLTELSGIDVRAGETWGRACRAIAGTSTPSNHSTGTAVDINAPANPYASASWHRSNANTTVRGKALRTEFNSDAVKLWEDHGFRWGGWYRTKPDPMHFEFMGTVDDARHAAARLRSFLGGEGNPAPPPPQKEASPPSDGLWREGDRGQKVKEIQALANAAGCEAGAVDGIWGPQTTSGVTCFQRKLKVATDGIWGAETQTAAENLLAYLAAQDRRPPVQRDDQGEHVKHAQLRLNAHGFSLRVDGVFGKRTERAVRQFQKGRGLGVDGIVGPNTWSELG